ncbi:hypothetical protein EIN_222260 [Entamoeba invadens IP1]|uniref:Meiosis protein 5 homolog n=1 Tax=Entamoeba invadens IP1 TaxID=370355 RepID=A0A0A1U7Z4_ENTIV|nr:hypothetical protein EIN_222260 [Entamoeba invadens IP1]ELP88083.1 hypothetical protein EIN_222260 [Entamoeba invadens IP1]|eukprot:XP_004254854.1 hypothetical protein EIN_222260 [Entamoeba invadens IP1]
MGEDSLSMKLLETIQEGDASFYDIKTLQNMNNISSTRVGEMRKSISILEECGVVKQIAQNTEDVYYLLGKKDNTQQSKTPSKTPSKKHRLRVSITQSSKYKLNEKTTVDDLPSQFPELQALYVELQCKVKKTKEKMLNAEKKARAATSCEGKNLNKLTKKWKELSRDILTTIKNNGACKKADGTAFTLEELMNSFDIQPALLGYDKENDDFVD